MSKVWGQRDERDWAGDEGYSASLREGVAADIQDFQARSSGCPRCLREALSSQPREFFYFILRGRMRTPCVASSRPCSALLAPVLLSWPLLVASWP